MSCNVGAGGSIVLLVARILMAQLFVISGYFKVLHFDKVTAELVNMGIPHGEIFVIIAIAFQFVAGVFVIFGWYTRFFAFLMFLYTIAVAYVYHSFWGYQGQEMIMHIHEFIRYTAIMGGTLYLAVVGAGWISLDGLRAKCKAKKEDKPKVEMDDNY